MNADSRGKALEHVYEAAITELFASVSARTLRRLGIQVRFAHLDTTAVSLELAPVIIYTDFDWNWSSTDGQVP